MVQERDRIKNEKLAMIKVVNSQKKSTQMISPRNSDKKGEFSFSTNNIEKTNLNEENLVFDEDDTDDYNNYISNKVVNNNANPVNDINSDLDVSKK